MIQELFPVALYREELNLNTTAIAKYCLDMKSVVPGVQLSNVGGWQSPKLTGQHEPLDTLFISISKAAQHYRDTIQYEHPLKINTLWVNINREKDYNLEHNHPNSVVSGVYYVKAQKKDGDLVLAHPASLLMAYDWHESDVKEFNKYNSAVWIIPPIENRLLLFPSWLRHSVKPNLT